jgi:predicted dehydrogenase
MNKEEINNSFSRRKFISLAGAGVASMSMSPHISLAPEKQTPPQQVEKTPYEQDPSKGWAPVSERKIRVGLVGFGYSGFSAAFGFQNHPNVEIVAVSDLFPERCSRLAEITHCKKTYPSLEDLVKDNKIEAVFVATDAPSHPKHCIEVLKHGKHVASAVPASYGSIEEAEKLFEAVKKSGLNYMMFETSCFHEDLHAMRQIYNAGGFGKLVYSEGEYYHYGDKPLPSYNGWRNGGPPQWYPTHSNAYYVGVTGGSFTEVSCLGMPSIKEINQPGKNPFNNLFATEVALFRTSEGGMARMVVSGDTPGFGNEAGRIRGQKGSFYGKYEGLEKVLPDLNRPPLPPGVPAGGHGGSHGPLMNEFVMSILQGRKPLVDIAMALNLTVSGIVASKSALKDGELMKIPQYTF